MNVTNVRFNGAEAQFSTLVGLTAIVPTNATTGPITVVTQAGSITTIDSFNVTSIGPPLIANFSPKTGYPGMTVTITGTNLTHITQVTFGGVASDSVTTMLGDTAWAGFPSMRWRFDHARDGNRQHDKFQCVYRDPGSGARDYKLFAQRGAIGHARRCFRKKFIVNQVCPGERDRSRVLPQFW